MIVVGAAVIRNGHVLAGQRTYPAAAAGRWELPGGRVEPDESEVDAVRRECREELGIHVRVGPRLGPDLPLHDKLVLRAYLAFLEPPDQTPHPHTHQALRWLSAGTLDEIDWLPADRALLPALQVQLQEGC